MNRLRLESIPEDSEICSPVRGYPAKRRCTYSSPSRLHEPQIPTMQFTKTFARLFVPEEPIPHKEEQEEEEEEERKTCSLREAYCSMAARVRF